MISHRQRRRMPVARLLPVLLLGLLVAGVSCKKRTGRRPVPTVDPVVFLPVPLAQRLPKDVEACFCTVNLNAHRQALLKSNFWRLVAAFLDDKAPTAGLGANAGTQFIKDFDMEDIALGAGPGSSVALAVIRQINDLYNESRYRLMLRGLLPGPQPDPVDLELLDTLLLHLERLEIPPLLFSMRGAQAHERLKQVTDWLMGFPAFAEAASALVTTTMGEQFGITVVDVGALWPLARRKAWLEEIFRELPGLGETAKGKLAHAVEVIASKPLVIALGRGKDTAFIGISHSKDQVRLAEGVEDSVVVRDELKFAQTHAGRDLLGFACWQPQMAAVLHQSEPSVALRGALVHQVPGLASLAAAAGAAEAALFQREFAAGAVAAWWDKGLHAEARGGAAGRQLDLLRKTSRFHPLADDESVVLAACGVMAGDGRWRAYVESAAALIDAAGASAGVSRTLVPFKPLIAGAWNALQPLWQTATGADAAILLDTGGRMPPLPGLPAGAEKMALPRLAVVHALVNRPAAGEAWKGLEGTLGKALSAVQPSQAPAWPPAESVRQKDLVSYFYPLSFGSEDLMPCASINDGLLIWGSSRRQQQQLVDAIAATPQPGWRLKIDFGRLRTLLRDFANVRGAQAAGDAALRDVVRWLGPLGVLDWREAAVEGGAQSRFSLQMEDIPAYD
jgi:hypothetical protein